MGSAIFARFVALLLVLASTPRAVASPLSRIFGRDANPAVLTPTEITINSAANSGSGCPRRTVSVEISTDRTAVTLGFDEFQTYIGKRFAASDRDKNCQIRLNLLYPGGYTFAVLEATYHGYAQLDAAVNGSFSTSYSFPGQKAADNAKSESDESTTQATIKGGGQFATGAVYTETNQVSVSARVRAPCGRNATMLIRTRVNLTASDPDAEGTLTGDDATFAFTQQMHIAWETCT
ncbi:hypothetical protein QBC47DRAFT_386768 [Echria macrotheca]|uniref:DUF4360 domain-containing protein n=1 Tax=Echria macrotheca TaxID=438768 RepID=A0AAJ0B8D3_9PEZI|nr:hypothetical protein QBC47DRAFT_386768 [Echria macrotheca]